MNVRSDRTGRRDTCRRNCDDARMAKKVRHVVELTDDLDGSVAVETVRFSYEGSQMEIDLSKKNKTAMDKALKPYITVARKTRTTRPGRRRAATSAAARRQDISVIRAWTKANGHEVSDRGRVAGSVVEAFEAAH